METVESGMAICDHGIVPLLSGFVWESSDSCTHRIGLIIFGCEVCRSALCGKSARYVRCGGRRKRNPNATTARSAPRASVCRGSVQVSFLSKFTWPVGFGASNLPKSSCRSTRKQIANGQQSCRLPETAPLTVCSTRRGAKLRTSGRPRTIRGVCEMKMSVQTSPLHRRPPVLVVFQ
jgi:hypothetical protein